MNADLDTLACQLYAPEDEILPGRRPEAAGGCRPERDGGPEPGTRPATDGFARSRERFETVLSFLGGKESGALEHAELEARLAQEGRELLCHLFQDHLDLRSEREPRLEEVLDAQGVPRTSVESGHRRALGTVFGKVR